jgi:hypothetical protein
MYWFGILHLDQEIPKLYGPFATREIAERKQAEIWTHRIPGEHTNPIFQADTEEQAREAFLYTSLKGRR